MTSPAQNLTIWCNASFPPAALDELRSGLPRHRLVFSSVPPTGNLVGSAPDPELERADVAFGQPDPAQVMRLPRLRWVHLTSAGYTRYDRDDLRSALRARGAALTNSSAVYAEPCAEHAFAMMLALARRTAAVRGRPADHASWRCGRAPHPLARPRRANRTDRRLRRDRPAAGRNCLNPCG
jgi:phosphoglycerate dehydrogenase-like enzyme